MNTFCKISYDTFGNFPTTPDSEIDMKVYIMFKYVHMIIYAMHVSLSSMGSVFDAHAARTSSPRR